MYIGEPVVLPDQLVRAVVLVRDRSASPGDRGYVPVVVGESAGYVAIFLVAVQQGHRAIGLSKPIPPT